MANGNRPRQPVELMPPTPEELRAAQQPQPESTDTLLPPTAEELRMAQQPSPYSDAPTSDVPTSELLPPTPEEVRAAQQQPDEEFGIMDAFAEGIRDEILPTTYSPEEISARKQRDDTGTEVAASLAGSITAGVAGTAAATKTGAIIGSALFPGLGTVIGGATGALLYATYSGIGQEVLQTELTGQEFSAARATLRGALQINPAVRATGPAYRTLAALGGKSRLGERIKRGAEAAEKLKGTRLVGQVAGEVTVAGTTYGAEEAALTGAVSTVLYGALFRRNSRPVSPNYLKDTQEFLDSPVGKDMSVRVANRVNTELANVDTNFSAKALTDESFLDYFLTRPGRATSAKSLSRMPLSKKVARVTRIMADEKTGGFTQEKMDEVYRGYLTQKITLDEATKVKKELQTQYANQILKGEAADIDPFSQLEDLLKDGKYIARDVDRVLGTDTSTLLDDLAERSNVFNVAKAKLLRLGIQAHKLQRKARLSNEDMGRLRVFLSEGDKDILTPEIRRYVGKDGKIVHPRVSAAIDAWDKAYESARREMEQHQLKVGVIPHYMPMKLMNRVELATAIRRSSEYLQGLAYSVGVDDFMKLDKDIIGKLNIPDLAKNSAIQELGSIKRMVGKLGVQPGERSYTNIQQLTERLLKTSEHPGFGQEISAMMSRKGGVIPPRFRELDIGKAYSQYLNGNVKSAMYDSIYSKMADNVERLKAVGLKDSADYFEHHLQQLSGIGVKDFGSMMQDAASKYTYNLQNFIDKAGPIMGTVGKAGLAVPDLMGKWQANLYSAFLGLNVRATLRNFTQNLTMTAPELGGTYGYEVVAKSMIKASVDWVRNPKQFARKMRTLGLESDRVAAEGLRGEDYGKIARGIGFFNDVAMSVYNYSDVINRYVAYEAGQILARDLAMGSPQATAALRKMGKATLANLRARGIQDMLRQGEVDKIGDLLGRSLVAKTQFHYGPEQRARFARTMGPMFSMFTKWPTAVGSNIIDIWKENPKTYGKVKRYFEVYGAQMALAAWAQHAIEENFSGDTQRMLDYMLGKPQGMLPLESVFAIDLLDAPLIQAGKGVAGLAGEIASGDKPLEASVRKSIKAVLKTSVPPVSSVINEIERYQRAMGRKTTDVDRQLRKATRETEEFLEDLIGG